MALVPASARMPARGSVHRAADVPDRIRQAIKSFESQIGGRKALLEALSTGDSDEDVAAVLDAIGDPKYDTQPLAKICAQKGISPGRLFHAFKIAALVRGQILGSLRAADLAPKVVDEIGKAAFEHEEVCTACNGVGSFEEEQGETVVRRSCTACNGVGAITRNPDPDQQRTILEMAGLVKGGGREQTIVQANITTSPNAAGGSLEQLQQAVSDLIYQRPQSAPTVDAVVVSSPPSDGEPIR